MLPVLAAEGQIVSERCGRHEQIDVSDLLTGYGEPGILSARMSGNGVVNAQHSDVTDNPSYFLFRLWTIRGTRNPAAELCERNNAHYQPVGFALTNGLYEPWAASQILDEPGAIEEVPHVPPLQGDSRATNALRSGAVLEKRVHVNNPRPAAAAFSNASDSVELGRSRMVREISFPTSNSTGSSVSKIRSPLWRARTVLLNAVDLLSLQPHHAPGLRDGQLVLSERVRDLLSALDPKPAHLWFVRRWILRPGEG